MLQMEIEKLVVASIAHGIFIIYDRIFLVSEKEPNFLEKVPAFGSADWKHYT